MVVLEQDALRGFGYINPYETPTYNILLVGTTISLMLAVNSALTMYFIVKKEESDVSFK